MSASVVESPNPKFKSSSYSDSSNPKISFQIPQFTFVDYSSFFAAGALCATLTHGAMTPIDVVKTRIQVDPALARQSLLSGGRYIVSKEGAGALLTGFGPTAVGYLVQVGVSLCP